MHAEPIASLSPELLARWEEVHASDSGQRGPFLHPAYAQAAGRVRSDVEVGIITHEGAVAGFLPFQRSILGVATPVGSRLCDMAGAVTLPGLSWNPMALARAAGLRSLRLTNVPITMPGWAPYMRNGSAAPQLDLSRGFESYRRTSLDSGSSFMRQLERKARKAERDLGPLRFQWHTEDDGVARSLLAWKATQRRATRTPNILRLRWARELFEELRRVQGEGFAGVLSTLHVGDTLAAAHFGIRTRDVMHYWIPAYNQELSKYSPGLIALVELARAAAERGIERLDLGSGEERYKLRAATGTQEMTHATVTPSLAVHAVTTVMDRGRSWCRGSRLGPFLRLAGRSMTRGSYAFQDRWGRHRNAALLRQTGLDAASSRRGNVLGDNMS